MEVKLFCTIPVARVFYMYLDLCYNGNMLHFLYDDEITIPTYLSGSIFHLIRDIKLALLIILEHKTSFNSQLIIFLGGRSYGGVLAWLGGLARLGEMIFIPRSYGIFYLSSIKKFVKKIV